MSDSRAARMPRASQQLAEIVEPFGYRVVAVEVTGCLHLKSACCYLGGDRILANRDWIDPTPLAGSTIVDVPAERTARLERSANRR